MLTQKFSIVRTLGQRFYSPFSSGIYRNKYEEQTALASNEATMETFWGEQAKLIDWYKEATTILDKSNPPFYRWFKGGVLNTSYNCIDRHVHAGFSNNKALLYESPLTNTSSSLTYGQLLDLVSRFANVLQKHGVEKGDRVIIYMPMIPETVIAMQACARIGAIHSVVFGGFAGPELASRIMDAEPKLIITASCGLEPNRIVDYDPMIKEALRIVGAPDMKRIIIQREAHKIEMRKGQDFEFYDEIEKAKNIEAVPLDALHPLYSLYTSGTTGTPKGIVRDHAGNAVALAYATKHLIDIGRSDVYFTATDIGWVTGHSYVAYGPLISGGTSLVYEGKPVGTPDAGILWRLCEKHKAKGMFTSPTAIRALRRDDPEAKYIRKSDLSSLKTLYIAGERLDIPTYQWINEAIPKSCLIVDNYWQTESGWQISANFINLHKFEPRPGSAGKPVPGNMITILDHDGNPLPANESGSVCLKHPTPPSFVSTLYKNDKAFVEKYMTQFPGYYSTGDAGYLDDEGYLFIMSRFDDIINTAGHRLSTSQIEEVLTGHKDIVEAAVVGATDELKGEVPVGFVVLKDGVTKKEADIEKECVQRIRTHIGPVASFKNCIVVDKLPKTRSGKIVRKVLRSMIDGQSPQIPPTIEDVNVVFHIKKQIEDYKSKTNRI